MSTTTRRRPESRKNSGPARSDAGNRNAKAEGRRTDTAKFRMEIKGLAYLFVAAFFFLCVFSFHPKDPTFNQAVSPSWVIHNLAGAVGSYLAGFLVELFGIGAMILPLVLAYIGLSQFLDKLALPWYRWSGLCGLFLCIMSWAAKPWVKSVSNIEPSLSSGGFFGKTASDLTLSLLSPWGSVLFWIFFSIVSVQIGFSVSWSVVFKRLLSILNDQWLKFSERRERRRFAAEVKQAAEPRKVSAPQAVVNAVRKQDPRPAAAEEHTSSGDDLILKPFEAPAPKRKPASEHSAVSLNLPSPELLHEVNQQPTVIDSKALQAKARQLTSCLADFNIQGEIQQVMPGPVVTMFEFKPAPGVKISTIAARNDDIALSLKALAVRIEAPIPGKDTVGVEIPNEKRQTVILREIIESPVFAMARSPLTLALGKDIQGAPQVADLAAMPHLLVAGATGAGKSVCLNGFLVSLLYKASPEQVKLLLIDPKRIELAIYSELPHLVHPVVTDMSLAKNALEWAMCEMDSRYETLARLGVRNIESFNQKLSEMGDKRPDDMLDLVPLPYLVIIIDELADLMMTAAKDVENCIVRLAQLARAAGIHMILATQRPSVDVVTGLIKANFPTRISFQVTSRHDSRTILDTVGAERLLGKGDMLFKSGGSKLKRMHGAYVDEREIEAVVNHWKIRQPQQFELDFTEWRKEGDGPGAGGAGEGGSGIADDPMYSDAVEFVMSQGRASISLIQRRFRIGFNRAARYIEQMEADGLLGAADGSKPRAIIKNRD